MLALGVFLLPVFLCVFACPAGGGLRLCSSSTGHGERFGCVLVLVFSLVPPPKTRNDKLMPGYLLRGWGALGRNPRHLRKTKTCTQLTTGDRSPPRRI